MNMRFGLMKIPMQANRTTHLPDRLLHQVDVMVHKKLID